MWVLSSALLGLVFITGHHVLCSRRLTQCRILRSLGWGPCQALGVPLPLVVAPQGMPRQPCLCVLVMRDAQLHAEPPVWLSCITLFFFFESKIYNIVLERSPWEDIQTMRKLRLRYAVPILCTTKSPDTISGRQTWASPQVSMDDVTLSSRVCSRALTTGPTPNCDAPPDCPHRVPQLEPNTRSGQSPDGVNSP
jgi:hypothetical protein